MDSAAVRPSSTAAGVGAAVAEGKRAAPPPDEVKLGGQLKKVARGRERICTAKERISRMPPCAAGKRSSIYRGVTRHRWTGRYEAHLWDKSTWNQNQNKKGKQVYLGAYDDEEAAARAYDLAALKYWGAGTQINFPLSDYSRDIEEMQMFSKEDYLVSLRRKSSAFSRGFPKYRGASRQIQGNRWAGSVDQMLGNAYFNHLTCSTSREGAMEEKFAGGFCMDRKTDLTSYIRWWMPKRMLVPNTEDIDRELKSLETSRRLSEPYRLPSLGTHQNREPQARGLSACSILSRSSAFRNLQEKLSESKSSIGTKESDHPKVAPQLFGSTDPEKSAVASAPYAIAPYLPVPSAAGWNPPINPPDPGYWTTFFPPT